MEELEVSEGWVDPDVVAELRELRLVFTVIEARAVRSGPGLRERMRDLSDRFSGPQAVMLRQQPIPAAYRIVFRHIGLDPDVDRTPVEALALERLKAGGFRSTNTLDDALTIATMETGVAMWALDAERVEGELGVRLALPGETLGRLAEVPSRVPEGRLVVADDAGPLAILFGDRAPGHGVTETTTRILLFSVLVAGVPEIHVEEAFWQVWEILTDQPED